MFATIRNVNPMQRKFQPKMSAQAQKLKIFEKKLSLGVRSPWHKNSTRISLFPCYGNNVMDFLAAKTFLHLERICLFVLSPAIYVWGFLSENYYILLDDFLKFLLTCGFPLNLQNL